jgi:hypothetical protein
MVAISGFSKLAKVRLVNRQLKYGPTFFINVHMHNLLGYVRMKSIDHDLIGFLCVLEKFDLKYVQY